MLGAERHIKYPDEMDKNSCWHLLGAQGAMVLLQSWDLMYQTSPPTYLQLNRNDHSFPCQNTCVPDTMKVIRIVIINRD